uniref:Uncharacterized protein n=1 Tax=Solanum lycopersicum TaxID=4081 RepID=A0A3Q7HLH4_SOLLC
MIMLNCSDESLGCC